ncbi:effector-associated constant component EACC1 [Nocardia brasiliensis]|uniref:effector-associated constant component EACC1 n=1 Tax=Nocardia brasiliensis TaxID=37326 RepID=UPI002453C9C0|nr:hypothetical protein [Nocardia brasiliensis]
MHVRVEIVGNDASYSDLVSLRQWLAGEDEFRGRVRIADAPSSPGGMGGIGDALIVGLGSGGAIAVLAGSLNVWLQNQRSAITIKILSAAEREIEITAEGPAADVIVRELRMSSNEIND